MPGGQTHVLTFGCQRTQKMYRALLPGPVPDARSKHPVVIESCPGCGDEHSTLDTFGRPLRVGDEIDVYLAPAPVVTDSASPPEVPPHLNHTRGNVKVADADVLAAIPTDQPAPAAEIARALGYNLTHTLIERVERLNLRAVIEWGHPLVQITAAETGRRERYLQRNGKPSPGAPEYRRAASRTDAEIIAAVPTEWTPATVVAEDLGFAYRTLKNRLLRIPRGDESTLETRLIDKCLQVKSVA